MNFLISLSVSGSLSSTNSHNMSNLDTNGVSMSKLSMTVGYLGLNLPFFGLPAMSNGHFVGNVSPPPVPALACEVVCCSITSRHEL